MGLQVHCPGGSVVHKAVRGLQQRKGVNVMLEGLQQLHSFLKLRLDVFISPIFLHDRQRTLVVFLTWQKGARLATRLSNATSFMDMYTAPSTTGQTLDVMCFKRAKNKSPLHGQDLHWLRMSYRLKVEGMQAFTL